MAGNSEDFSNTSKRSKGTTEKKKRKRPSKKVPTTILQANSSGFMNLVQKLTGSAEEIAAAAESSNLSPCQSPYSSPSNQQPETTTTTTYQTVTNVDVDPAGSHGFGFSSATYSTAMAYPPSYQQFNEPPATSNYGYSGYGSGGYVGSGSRSYGEDDDSSYGYRGSGNPRFNNDNNSNSSPSSSRGMDQHDVSPLSRYDHGNQNSSADYYWY